MTYQFTPPPSDEKSFQQWVITQFRQLAVYQPDVMPTLTVPPKRLQEGLTVKAGAPWNPGSGDGVYQYRGGLWRFLG